MDRTDCSRRPRTSARLWSVAAALALTLSWGGAADSTASPAADTGLTHSLDHLLADKRLAGGEASVSIRDARTGQVLYAHQPDTRLMPASNTKLLTSTAAMHVLGPQYRYHTDVLADGARGGGTLHGDLYLRGTGDPTLLAKDYDHLAAEVAAAGITRVTGRLVADDTRFDNQRLGTGWAADDESEYYSSQISALSLAPDTDYDAGCVYLRITPGARPGAAPKVTVTPPNHYVHLVRHDTTVAKGESNTLSVERAEGTNTITISGDIPVGADPTESWTSVWQPTGYAASVFADALARHGVHVAGATRLGHATPHRARLVADHPSMTLSHLMVPFLKLSNNNHAEVLTKTIGYRTTGHGTWDAGLAGISHYVKKEGVDTSQLRQVDGSGLSRMDNVPSDQLARLLVAVRHEPWFHAWYQALPIACESDRMVGGTLRSRMCGTPAAHNAHGKTGSLTGASSLSGYVTDADGRQLVYSIVLNNYLADSVEDIEDAIVVDLASYSASGHAVQPHRSPSPGTADQPGTSQATRSGQAARGTQGGTAATAGLECSWTKPATC